MGRIHRVLTHRLPIRTSGIRAVTGGTSSDHASTSTRSAAAVSSARRRSDLPALADGDLNGNRNMKRPSGLGDSAARIGGLERDGGSDAIDQVCAEVLRERVGVVIPDRLVELGGCEHGVGLQPNGCAER